MWLVGLNNLAMPATPPAGAFHHFANEFNAPSAVAVLNASALAHDSS